MVVFLLDRFRIFCHNERCNGAQILGYTVLNTHLIKGQSVFMYRLMLAKNGVPKNKILLRILMNFSMVVQVELEKVLGSSECSEKHHQS